MSLDFNLDLGNDTEERIEAGDRPGAGWYIAELEDVWEDEQNQGVVQFKYKILSSVAGQWDGRALFDRINDPEMAESEDAAKNARRRIKLLAKRLGLIGQDEYGKSDVQKSWLDARGTRVLLEVRKRSWKDKATGEPWEMTGIDFAGVYPLDHPLDKLKSFPAELRGVLQGGAGAPAARATPGANPAPATGGAMASTMAAATAPSPVPPPGPKGAPPPAAPSFDFSDL
jgi:hypothetical protein